jgi:hypothetical protein
MDVAQMKQVKVDREDNKYRASLDGSPDVRGYGNSIDAAVGDMIRCNHEMFDIAVSVDWTSTGGAGMAECGCVYHAEQDIPCEHDRALAQSTRPQEEP